MGKIKVTRCEIEGLCVVEPTVFGDDRGYFVETYNYNDFKAEGLDMTFVQDNQSMSVKGVLRGLHYQKQFPQGKLVRVVSGKVFDVAVDLRTGSRTYGKWFGVELSGENKKMFYIPEGFAQGGSLDFASSPLAWVIYQAVHNLKWIGSGLLVLATMALMWWNRVLILRSQKAPKNQKA